MRAKKARREFERYLSRRGGDVGALNPWAGVDAMLGFYRDVRARDCDIAQDGDMLLFQWGICDWAHGEHFEFNIALQFMVSPGEDEDIWQLSLTFRFAPDDALRALDSGDRWCYSPQQVEEFATFVRGTAAYVAVAERRPASVSLDYGCAG
jgi:uncharacterized protein (DUF2237 family)